MRDFGWACSSAGEHCIDIAGVTGSIPVTPTIRTSLFALVTASPNLLRLSAGLAGRLPHLVDGARLFLANLAAIGGRVSLGVFPCPLSLFRDAWVMLSSMHARQ